MSNLLQQLSDAVVSGEEELAAAAASEALTAGVDATEAAIQGLTRGIDEVGQRFAEKEYYLTDVILALDAFKAGLQVLRPHIKSTSTGEGNHDVATHIQNSVQAKVQIMLCGDPETSTAACRCNTCVKIYEQMSAFVAK
ncbi:MAG: hypothetical protein B9S32_01080 [Verrucomicrobia bacterium Tous-C9LFEB]|nr:MAG: hypothetical protein B9S32_01080 [Verrucomicrobia bacterium Tous-C9LFEB]